MAVAKPSSADTGRETSTDEPPDRPPSLFDDGFGDGLPGALVDRRKVVKPVSHHRILFVSSAGGHLAQLLQLRPWWINHERRWVSFDLPDARSKLEGEELIAAHHPTTRNLLNLARNTPLAWRVLRDFEPDVVVSNGAGVALPFFAVAKVLGVPTVYLEVYDRIDSRTMTGRLCRPLASMFCVQWPEQQRLYAGSTLTGPLY